MKNVTFVMLKPDAVDRGLAFTVMRYFEKRGIFTACFDIQTVTAEKIRKHYAEHIQKYGPDFDRKVLEMFEGKTVVPIVLTGPENIIAEVRDIVGATQPAKAEKGTIRGDLGLGDCYERSTPENRLVRNLIHASDTPENVRREIAIWLPDYPLD